MYLFLLQVIAHIGLISLLFTGSVTQWLIVFFIYFLTGCLGITVTFHRYISHNTWNPPKWWIYIGSILGAYGLVGSPLAWSNTHIGHHVNSDKPGDPHSPKVHGYIKAQWFSVFYSLRDFKYVKSKMSPFQKFLHRHYYKFHLAILVGLLATVGWHWTSVLYLAPAAVLWNAGSMINTICHTPLLGYRTYDTPDTSTNNPILGVFMWGEGWHNNHHRRPGAKSIGMKWWELDIGYWCVRAIEKISGRG